MPQTTTKKCNFNWSIVSGCDIIGQEPTLRIGNTVRNQTIWGGLLCILLILLLFVGFLYFGQEIYYKQQPETIESTLLTSESDIISISPGNFSIFFAIQDSNGDYIDFNDGYFNISMNLLKLTRNSAPIESEISSEAVNIETTPLKYTVCSREEFDSYGNSTTFLNPKNHICLSNANQDSSLDLSIYGSTSLNQLQYLQIEFSKCTTDSNCKSQSEIDTKLNGSVLLIKYIESIVDFRKFQNFLTQVLKEEKIYLFPTLTKSVDLEILKVEMKTDTGYMLESFESIEFFEKLSINANKISESADNTKLGILNVLPAYKTETYYRKYYKVQNLLAEMGGLAKSFLIIAFILNYFHDQATYYEKLIDDLFDVDDLYRYFQYYNPNNKQIFRKYRDSIILKNTKAIDDLKRDFEFKNSSVQQLKQNNYLMSDERNRKTNDKRSYFNIKDDISNGSSTNNFRKLIQQEKQKVEDINRKKCKSDVNSNTSANNVDAINNPEITHANPQMNNVVSSISEESNDSHDVYIEGLKKNSTVKDNFYKVKKKRFSLNAWELFKFYFCPRKFDPYNKKQIAAGGKEMINTRTNLIYLLRKNLEFDRFKNLMLKDYQLLLLNSLSKFMLDPEQVNLVDFETCTYEKLIDAYSASMENKSMVDKNLSNWIRTKFHIE